ncbi:MAG: hypothetical protein ABSC21_10490 [Terriglobia bacterium]|jgi:hypothetical protein
MSEMVRGDETQAACVLVTAIRNEEAHIEKTIRSVVGQTVPPLHRRSTGLIIRRRNGCGGRVVGAGAPGV